MSDTLVAVLLKLLELLGPTLVAALTVPLMAYLKKGLGLLDNAPPIVQQIVVILLAFGLTQLGTWLNVQLPTDLAFFTADDIGSLLSAAMAMAIHAGKKGKSP